MKAGIWTTSIQVVGKSFGLFRSLVLARLLVPDDIGLFGITAVVLSLITRFSNVGLKKAIIQKAEEVDDYLDTAWTFNVLRASLFLVGLWVAAPWIAAFFEEPAAEPLIPALGLGLLLVALGSPRLPLLPRELEFRRRFLFMLTGVVSDLLISIVAAIILRNAWALMLGFVGSKAAQVVVSYILLPHRPVFKIEISKFRELAQYGRWVFFNQVLFFLQYRGDNVLVGKVFGATGLGVYLMAYAICEAAITQIGNVTTDVSFPSFARAQNDLPWVRRAFLTNLEWMFDMAFPVAVVMALCAEPLTAILLGEHWVGVAVILPYLAVAACARTLIMVANALSNGLGRPDVTLRMNLFIVGVTYALYFPLVSVAGMRGVGMALVLGQVGVIPVYAGFARRVAGIPRLEMLRCLGPGFLLGACMAAVLLLGRTGDAIWMLLVTLTAAALVYVGVAFLLWRARQVGPFMMLQRLRTAYGRA
jgi:O-antigen/teichoic acid export membrane protein